MRLSRPRVALRVVLLAAGGAFMLWRAALAWRGNDALEPGAAALQGRVALVEGLVGALALLTAGAAALSLRRRPRARTLSLPREPSAGPEAPTGVHPEEPMIRVPPGVVDGATAARLAEAGAVVVDVRTPAEFAAGHVPGARNVPWDQIARRAAELGPPSTPVVLYCRSGQRSAAARAQLARLGFEQVWDAQRYDAWPTR